MRIKICGLMNIEDATHCHQLHAWGLGFNFYPKSPRFISKTEAKKIMEALPNTILKVGIFVDTPYGILSDYMEDLGLDLIQVYSPLKEAPNSFKERVILSLQAATKKDLPPASIMNAYGYVLMDAPSINHDLPGGTGRRANWDIAETLASDYRLILAGGLNADNAKEAIQNVDPYAIDLASGVEHAPGIKDKAQITRLFEECK